MSANAPTASFSSPFCPGVMEPPVRPAREIAASMFELHHAELYRAALRSCRDPETAEDLVQEALLRLMVEIDANRAPDNARAWLYRVIANLAVSLGRRASVSRKFAPALVSHDQPATPEAIVIDVERRSDLAAALDGLPDRARTALLLAASGYSGAEIATAIGSTDCATRTLMCRARLKLRDRLAADGTAARESGVQAPTGAARRPAAPLCLHRAI
jgi:RNA polymerase sigma-70 factor (ECF subfamily)